MKTKLFNLILIATIAIFYSCQKEPTASFTASSTSVNVGETVTFTNTSLDANSFLWDFGDGGSSITESPSHIYDTMGIYTITLTAFSKDVNKQDIATKEITVNPLLKPSVTTSSVTSVTQTSAVCGGNVTDDGGATVIASGVCWNTTENPTTSDEHTTDGSGTGTFTSSISNLSPNTTYYIRSYATNIQGTAYGNEVFFTTLYPCGQPFVDTRDSKTYNTIQIGSQCWMEENLNYNTGSGSYCYNENSSNCDTYGRLYKWSTACNACPDGWHLPTDDEWTELTDYLGGTSVAGGKMKETGTIHWNLPNTGATNSSSFTALPGGYRNYYYGNFSGVGVFAFFWSSSEYGADNAGEWVLSNDNEEVHYLRENRAYGFSVRCVKD